MRRAARLEAIQQHIASLYEVAMAAAARAATPQDGLSMAIRAGLLASLHDTVEIIGRSQTYAKEQP